MDYISKEALVIDVQRYLNPNVDDDGTVTVENAERWFLSLINNQPIADVVEVVRCKNCLHKINYKGRAMCTLYAEEAFGVWYGLNATRDEHFCSYGERKDT